MSYCRACGLELTPGARFCKSCGAIVPATQHRARRRVLGDDAPSSSPARAANDAFSLGVYAAVFLASLCLVFGPFLAWAEAGGLSASGMQKTGHEAVILVLLGVVGIAVAVISVLRREDVFNPGLVFAGLVCLGMSAYYLHDLRGQAAVVSKAGSAAAVGAGVHVCLVASIVVLLSAVALICRGWRRTA